MRPTHRATPASLLLALAMALGMALAGCGQKGPLYLPEPDAAGVARGN
jgi:predicted small lipoprotein YifL